MSEYRPLTRKERLEYLIQFLEAQKRQNEEDLKNAREEYRLILKKEGAKNES